MASKSPAAATFDTRSLAAVMREIFDVSEMSHQELVLVRRKVIQAYATNSRRDVQFVSSIGMVMLERIVGGASVDSVLGLSDGKLIKLARKYEQRTYGGAASGDQSTPHSG